MVPGSLHTSEREGGDTCLRGSGQQGAGLELRKEHSAGRSETRSENLFPSPPRQGDRAPAGSQAL